jgi:hypothetical protein
MAKNVGPAALPCGIVVQAPAEPAAIERQILDFLDGRSDGAMLFDALYGDTLDELLPPRLADLVGEWRAH